MSARAGEGRRWRWMLGLAALAVPGFGLGVVAGLVWEEPSLVASYVLGGTESVGWGEDDPASPELPAVAARPEPAPQAAPPAKPAPKPKAAPSPPPDPKPRVSKPVSAPGAPRFVIQVGAFGERAGADQLAADLRGKGYPVQVSQGDSKGARWRVRVGPSDTREAAEKTAARLKQSERLPTWVLEEGS